MQPPQHKQSMEFSNMNWDKATVKSETETSTTSSLPPTNWAFSNQTNEKASSLGNIAPSTSSSQNSTPCRYELNEVEYNNM